jgi:hypothetical protein
MATQENRPLPEPLIPKHGGYRNLKSFQVAQLTYDVTVRFCDRYIDRRSRTPAALLPKLMSGAVRVPVAEKAVADAL